MLFGGGGRNQGGETNPDGTQEIIFYSEGKETAKELLDKDDTVIETVGKVPDALVTEFVFDGAMREEVYYKKMTKRLGVKFRFI